MLVPIPSSKTPSCPEPSDWHALALLLEVTAQRTRQIQPPILRPFLQAVTDKQTVLSTTHPARFRTTPTSLPDWSWRTEVAYLQREDPTLKPLFTYLVHGHLPLGLSPKSTEHFKAQSTFFDFSGDGLLVHLAHPSSTRGGRELIQQIVIPRALVPKILDAYHDSPLGGGRLAAVKTLSKILFKYWWEDMRKDVTSCCQSCLVCQQRKSPHRRQVAPVGRHPPVSFPFQRIGLDYLTIQPPTQRGKLKVLVVTDHLTKYSEAFAFAKENSRNTAQVLFDSIVCRHGCPRQIQRQALPEQSHQGTDSPIRYQTYQHHPVQSSLQRPNRTLQQHSNPDASRICT